MTGAHAQPPIAQDVDIRDFAFTPMFRARLFGSSFHARASDSEWRAGVTLWLKSWDQVPAGSLPDDDVDLCRLAELGRDIKTWKKIKAGALHGWNRCADGRLYHSVVAEGVNDAWKSKLEQRWRSECGRIKKHNQRHANDPSAQLPIQSLEEFLSRRQTTVVLGDKYGVSLGTEPECPETVPEETPSKRQGQGDKKDISGAHTRPVDVIQAFDAVLHEVYGVEQSRPNAHSTDHVYASRFLDSGADLDLIIGTIRPIVQRFRVEGQRAPSNLKMFETWIAGALTAKNAPPAEARYVNGTRPSKPSLDDQFAVLDRLGSDGPSPVESFGDPAGGPIIEHVAVSH